MSLSSYINSTLIITILLVSCSEDSQTNENIAGCMDPEACNYNSEATVSSNSCDYELDCSGVCGGDDFSCSEGGSCIGYDLCISIDGLNLIYDSNVDIYGFQFDHSSCVESAYGGQSEQNGLSITFSSSTVLAFSFSGDMIPIGSGTLISLEGNVNTSCISNFVASGLNGSALSVNLFDSL